MPVKDDTPETLRPFLRHGMDLARVSGGQAVGSCPLCGKDGKFYVDVTTGKWDCKVCAASGNRQTFLRQLWTSSYDMKDMAFLDALRADRGLLYAQTLSDWGVCRSCGTGETVVPGYGPGLKVDNVYRYVEVTDKGKAVKRLYSTAGADVAMFVPDFDDAKSQVYVFEGPWDGMAAHEVLRGLKRSDDGRLAPTATADLSLLKDVNVVAVPGCGAFPAFWERRLGGKTVTFFYDNDHPRALPTGKLGPPAGTEGMRRAAQKLAAAEHPPAAVRYLCWGPDGYDPTLPDGYDVRDHLAPKGQPGGLVARGYRLTGLIDTKTAPVPDDWLPGRTAAAVKAGGTDLEPVPCSSWRTLVGEWRKAMKWNEGLDRALACMLAAVTSTEIPGDQLWVKVVGPASCGKSTLCEAVAANRKFVVAKSTLTGFHSGFKSDGGPDEDNGLLAQIIGKTLVTKDGDTLLQAPNLPVILSQARDIYDGNTATHYGNKMGKSYIGFRVTWVLCGTSSLRALDASELGERFLDCVIMDRIDTEMEMEVGRRKLNEVRRNLRALSDATHQTGIDSAEMLSAKRHTAGYVEYLRQNARQLAGEVEIPDHEAEQCLDYGTFVAYMRARPSKSQQEEVHRELSTRLVSQLMRLTAFTSIVLNKPVADQEVMRRIKKTALDTARGRTLNVAQHLRAAGEDGLTTGNVALFTNETEGEARKLLKFLRDIKVCMLYQRTSGGVRGKTRWRLTDEFRERWDAVMGYEETDDE